MTRSPMISRVLGSSLTLQLRVRYLVQLGRLWLILLLLLIYRDVSRYIPVCLFQLGGFVALLTLPFLVRRLLLPFRLEHIPLLLLASILVQAANDLILFAAGPFSQGGGLIFGGPLARQHSKCQVRRVGPDISLGIRVFDVGIVYRLLMLPDPRLDLPQPGDRLVNVRWGLRHAAFGCDSEPDLFAIDIDALVGDLDGLNVHPAQLAHC
ncbi:uncharacterized protein PgNI_01455 [Pyricularia grisea]|uniref:Uncharacterized protein n=1 Tax=Pyricularia grisea TaxID=148305 RepID=A0A6P8BH52_PYRGI|nr:uncharacterized protein PgNI_01455 [Pyricularia grisea]TLD15982.1 hypothetical protein PgNI_01455 [Pyricularia grisea]